MSAGSAPPPAGPPLVDAPPPAPEGPRERGSWGPVRVLAGLGVLLALTLLGAVVGSFFDPDLDSLGARLYLQAVLAAGLVGVAFLAAGERGAASPRALGLGESHRSPVVPVLIALGVYLASAMAIGALLDPEQEDVTRELGWGESTVGDVLSFALIVLAAPLGEEVFFRGFMFAGIRSRAPFVVAGAISAAVWGLFHYTGPGSWPVVLQLTIFGFVLAWLYERTGSIRAPLFLHAANNLLAFMVLTSQ